MGATTHTATLLLPQFSDTDKPTWRGDINPAFASIEAGVANAVANAASNAAKGRGKNPLTGYFHVEAYGADPTAATNSDAAFTAVMADANVNGGVVYAPGKYALSTGIIKFAHDGVKLRGVDNVVSQLIFTGAGVGVDYVDTAVRRNCGIEDLYLTCMTAGATAYRLSNSYRGFHLRSKFESQNGTTGIGVDFAGGQIGTTGVYRSTYFNEFQHCSAWGSLDSVRFTDDVNGTRWWGGVLEGPGRSLHMRAPTMAVGTNMFFGVGIQSSGANTSNEIVRIGDATDAFGCSYNTWSACRVETATASVWVNESKSWYNVYMAGSIAAPTTITDNVTTTGAKFSTFGVYGSSIKTTIQTLQIPSTLIVGDPTTTSLLQTGSYLQCSGAAALQHLYLSSKGSGSGVEINAQGGSGDRGLEVYDGSGNIITAIGSKYLGYGIKINGSGTITPIRVTNTGEVGDRFKMDNTGKMYFGDGTGAFACTMKYYPGADSNHAVFGMEFGLFKAFANTTANRPAANSVPAGTNMFDQTLNKPIWSTGAAWVDATGAAV